jgi:hypothetical protein
MRGLGPELCQKQGGNGKGWGGGRNGRTCALVFHVPSNVVLFGLGTVKWGLQEPRLGMEIEKKSVLNVDVMYGKSQITVVRLEF